MAIKKPTPFPGLVGDRVLLDPDTVLDMAKGTVSMAAVIGIDKRGNLYIASSHGMPETITVIERAKLWLLTEGGQ